MGLNYNQRLDGIIQAAFPSKDITLSEGNYNYINGQDKYFEATIGVKKLHDEVYYTLFGHFQQFATDNGLKMPNDGLLYKTYFGIFTHLEHAAAANMYVKSNDGFTSRLMSVIMMNYDTYKKVITKNRPLARLYMLHEMLHNYYQLGEAKNYAILANFYKHMEFISYGDQKKEYHHMAHIAAVLLKAYSEHPYEAEHLALNYIDKELSRNDISSGYRSELMSLKAYLVKKAEDKKDKKKEKKEGKKEKKKKEDGKKGESKKKEKKGSGKKSAKKK